MSFLYDLDSEVPASYVFEAHRHDMKPVRKLYIVFWNWDETTGFYRVFDALDGKFVCVLWWKPSDDLDDLSNRMLALIFNPELGYSRGTVFGNCKVLGA